MNYTSINHELSLLNNNIKDIDNSLLSLDNERSSLEEKLLKTIDEKEKENIILLMKDNQEKIDYELEARRKQEKKLISCKNTIKNNLCKFYHVKIVKNKVVINDSFPNKFLHEGIILKDIFDYCQKDTKEIMSLHKKDLLTDKDVSELSSILNDIAVRYTEYIYYENKIAVKPEEPKKEKEEEKKKEEPLYNIDEYAKKLKEEPIEVPVYDIDEYADKMKSDSKSLEELNKLEQERLEQERIQRLREVLEAEREKKEKKKEIPVSEEEVELDGLNYNFYLPELDKASKLVDYDTTKYPLDYVVKIQQLSLNKSNIAISLRNENKILSKYYDNPNISINVINKQRKKVDKLNAKFTFIKIEEVKLRMEANFRMLDNLIERLDTTREEDVNKNNMYVEKQRELALAYENLSTHFRSRKETYMISRKALIIPASAEKHAKMKEDIEFKEEQVEELNRVINSPKASTKEEEKLINRKSVERKRDKLLREIERLNNKSINLYKNQVRATKMDLFSKLKDYFIFEKSFDMAYKEVEEEKKLKESKQEELTYLDSLRKKIEAEYEASIKDYYSGTYDSDIQTQVNAVKAIGELKAELDQVTSEFDELRNKRIVIKGIPNKLEYGVDRVNEMVESMRR